jgi:L-fuconolactonase
MGRVIDTHVHVWDPAVLRYPWQSGDFDRPFLPADIPRRPGDDTAMIFVEAGCADGAGEAQWVAGLDWPERVGIVAQVDLSLGDAVAEGLDRLAAVDGVVGVRWNLEDRPLESFESPALLTGLRRVAARGLTFDACVRHHQLEALTTLVARVPELPVVLDHLGKPDMSRPLDSAWLNSIEALAEMPHVSIKLSGAPPESDPGRAVGPQAGPFLNAALDAFGPARSMLGSDWPVSAATPHHIGPGEWFDLVFTELGASPEERAQVGWHTASTFYGILAGAA